MKAKDLKKDLKKRLFKAQLERRSDLKDIKKLTREEKERQVRQEAKATMILFIICFAINVLAALFIKRDAGSILHLPIWWWISVPGMWVVSVVGVVVLLKTVFTDFELEDEVQGLRGVEPKREALEPAGIMPEMKGGKSDE